MPVEREAVHGCVALDVLWLAPAPDAGGVLRWNEIGRNGDGEPWDYRLAVWLTAECSAHAFDQTSGTLSWKHDTW